MQVEGRARERAVLTPVTATLTVLLDQIVKWLVLAGVPAGTSVPLIPGVLWLTPVENRGIAFGLFPGLPRLAAILVALTVLLLLFYNQSRSSALLAPRSDSRPGRRRGPVPVALTRVAVGLVAGGAVGNLIDRIRLGYVVDYLDLRWWPVFNLADAAVVCGAGLILLAFLRPTGDQQVEA